MSDPRFVIENGSARTVLDLRVYRLAAAKKAAYRLADRCTAAFGAVELHSVPVTFLFPPGTQDDAMKRAMHAFFEELLDQDLREQVAEETGPVRALILAHAFSKTDLIRRK